MFSKSGRSTFFVTGDISQELLSHDVNRCQGQDWMESLFAVLTTNSTCSAVKRLNDFSAVDLV